MLKEFPGVLILRLRMPIVTDLLYPRNFITKILRYEKASPCLSAICYQNKAAVEKEAECLNFGVCADHQHPEFNDSPTRASPDVSLNGTPLAKREIQLPFLEFASSLQAKYGDQEALISLHSDCAEKAGVLIRQPGIAHQSLTSKALLADHSTLYSEPNKLF